ncbi:MAG: lipid-A-disaccharide synthase [Elusimicrobia bacterium]|nr:lipid-A-disaccharide synthase [Elusimicrobiota bacterium]
MKKNILVVAGDLSGDLHGSHLIRALKRRSGDLRVTGVGGPMMREVCDEFMHDLASLGVTGFWEPIKRLPLWAGLLRKLGRWMDREKPAALVTIDFYGFNHQVLQLARKRRLNSFYYISPQVWASRAGRIRRLAGLVRHMLVIFPFEEEIYRKAGVPCTFVGHPLLEILPAVERLPGPRQGEGAVWNIGLLPGSRPAEIRRHLPVFLKAVEQLSGAAGRPVRAVLFAPPGSTEESFRRYRRNASVDFEFVGRTRHYERRAEMDLAITSSGTATLENALLGIPMVVVYKLSWLSYRIAKSLIQVPFISMANILSRKAVVPELIQGGATAPRIAEEAVKILRSPERLRRMREELLSLRPLLGSPGCSERAAQVILDAVVSQAAARR